MNRLINLLILISAFLTSCSASQRPHSEEDSLQTTRSGLKYRILHDAGYEKASIGDILVMNMRYSADTLKLFDSYLSGAPMHMQITKPAYKGSFEEGFTLLGKGDSAILICSADSVFEKVFRNDLPGRLAKGSEMVFNIAVEDVRNEEEELNTYLNEQQIAIKPRASGLYAIQLIKGEGPKPEVGKNVVVHYKTLDLNGREIRNSYTTDKPLKFKMGMGSVIDAWEEILKEMQVGDKYRLISPSYIAYGARWFENTPPYSPLVFDIELIEAEQ